MSDGTILDLATRRRPPEPRPPNLIALLRTAPGPGLNSLTAEPERPTPTTSAFQVELAAQEQAQAQQNELDRREMLVRLREKRLQLASSAVHSADPRAAIADASERYQRDRLLAAAEQRLING